VDRKRSSLNKNKEYKRCTSDHQILRGVKRGQELEGGVPPRSRGDMNVQNLEGGGAKIDAYAQKIKRTYLAEKDSILERYPPPKGGGGVSQLCQSGAGGSSMQKGKD